MRKIFWLLIAILVLVVLAIVIINVREQEAPVTNDRIAPDQNLIRWQYDGKSWTPNTSPPPCPTPLEIPMPVDAHRVTGLLYPGQYRGDQFKPHGGFRFDNSLPKDIAVRSPVDGYITIAAAYLSAGSDDVQRMIDIITPCGMMYRFDHLADLSPKLQAALSFLPAPKVHDSRGHFLPQPLLVSRGEVLATSVGFEEWQGSRNVFVDFGVYNLSEKNQASQRPDWPADDHGWSELAPYALCWVDYLEPDSLRSLLKSLPTGNEGSVSEYCL